MSLQPDQLALDQSPFPEAHLLRLCHLVCFRPSHYTSPWVGSVDGCKWLVVVHLRSAAWRELDSCHSHPQIGRACGPLEGSALFLGTGCGSSSLGESVLALMLPQACLQGDRAVGAASCLGSASTCAQELELSELVPYRNFLSFGLRMWLGLPPEASAGSLWSHAEVHAGQVIRGSVCVPITRTLGCGLLFKVSS